MKSVTHVYQSMVKNHNKLSRLDVIDTMIEFCKKNSAETIFLLKKKMETEFAKDVKCQYTYSTTPQNYGCDLRELFFTRDGNIISDNNDNNDEVSLLKRGELLTLFYQKKIETPIPHIMTDIDDTLFAHSAHGFAGEDESWIQKIPFPGIKTFYQLFYSKLEEQYRYSTILSATPGPLKMERINDIKIKSILGPQQYGFIQGEEGKMNVLKLALQIMSDSKKAFKYTGSMKYRRCVEYSRLFPEFKLIFIGDNGQGDLIGGLKILEDIPTSSVFIHIIMQNNGTIKVNLEEKENPYPNRLFFFKNYLELGKLFQQQGIFSESDIDQLRSSVIQDIHENINKICKSSKISVCKTTNEYKKMLRHYFCCEQTDCLMPPHCIEDTDIHSGGTRKKYIKSRRKKRRTNKTI